MGFARGPGLHLALMLSCVALPAAMAGGAPDTLLSIGFVEIIPMIPECGRLHPGQVKLEHTHLGEDDSTWVTESYEIGLMTRFWGDSMRDMPEFATLVAPGPLTRDQALALLPGASEIGSSVLCMAGEHAFTYGFDSLGRTVEVDWDPVADSGVYRFVYRYCASDSPPVWID